MTFKRDSIIPLDTKASPPVDENTMKDEKSNIDCYNHVHLWDVTINATIVLIAYYALAW